MIKVLIVDDLPINLKLLRALLQAEGMLVVEAENGREALAVLAREAVDCVVTDVLMPEMDGYRLCQEIRADESFSSVPIIVYTSTFVSPSEEKLALDAGGDIYIRKPAPAETMCAAIRELTTHAHRRTQAPSRPETVLKHYSEALIRKIEEKNDLLVLEQEKFRQITETIQEVFWITNRDLSQIVFISPGYEALWGRTCESLYRSPRDWMDGIHPDDRERVRKAAVERMGVEPLEMEYRIVRPDGGTRWAKVRSFPVKDEAGLIYRVTGTVTDITEQKRLLAQFEQAQKMEAIGRLAGGVAHDFNNLLTVILGLAELNIADLPEGQALRADFEEIKSTGERAAQLTQQLLAFSRRQVFESRACDLNRLVKDTERLLHRLIGENIELKSKLAPDLRPALIDPNQIAQVLMNLCVNSRDAMPKGGRLLIETADVSLKHDLKSGSFTIPTGEYALLSVADTGEGMSAEVLSHIFEPFFTTKPVGKGTGLGLATCYGIIKQSNGFKLVESELGKGTVMKIFLPLAEAGASLEAAPVKKMTPAAKGRETILVVEDESAVRGLVRRILQADGYVVVEGSNGEEGLAIVQADLLGKIRLVLTDVVMPVMNGKQLADGFKKSRPDIRVLFASGYPDDNLSEHGVLDKGVSLLRKPFTPDSLKAKVRAMLDSN